MDVTHLAVTGAIVGALFLAAAITVVVTSAVKARTAMLTGAATLIVAVGLLLTAQALQSLSIFVVGATVAGIATALGYRGSLQVINELAPKDQRAEVIPTFAAVCFVGNALPVIGVGVVSSL